MRNNKKLFPVLMKDSIPQNEKLRMCISSSDLNFARINLCDFIKNDIEFCRNSTDVICFSHELIVNLYHIVNRIVSVSLC